MVRAPSQSCQTLYVAPQERKRNVIHPTYSAGRTVPCVFHDEEQPWCDDELNAVRA